MTSVVTSKQRCGGERGEQLGAAGDALWSLAEPVL